MTAADLLPMLVAVPLLAAFVATLLPGVAARRAVGLVVNAGVLVAAVVLVVATRDGDVVVAQVAGWPAGIAIPLAADPLSALMVLVASLLVTTCLAFAAASGDDRDRWFVPLALVLSGGVYGAFVTADLFNLFVLVEVALLPSYVLLTAGARREQLRAGRIYLSVNLLGSTILLAGIALLYGVTGTVNLGELAGAAAESDAAALAAGVVLVAFGVKAALVPAHGWLPATYPAAPPAVTALFSGLLTKIGVYALFRVYAVVFDGDARLSNVLLVVFLATMVVGVLGALGEGRMRSILVFHMISQVGYILLGLSFFGLLGVTAGIFYFLHHTVVKASLLLSAGAVETATGTDRLDRLGGLARREPLLAVAFLVAALSLAGLPPFSGFIAKLVLVRAAFAEQAYLAAGLAVGVSLFTLLSMMKIWNGVFWGEAPQDRHPERVPTTSPPLPRTEEAQDAPEAPATLAAYRADAARRSGSVPLTGARMRSSLVWPGAVLAAVSIAVGLGAELVLQLAETAAAGLVDPSAYVEAVSGQ
ncbi:MAG TPA: monovalent cation/H+ antiporter subunit D family protein [Mycobacteriales bacterium]|nr:monovalent cation/H+ antiporter subunit D family protein [Mycobacteriales bacterium]